MVSGFTTVVSASTGTVVVSTTVVSVSGLMASVFSVSLSLHDVRLSRANAPARIPLFKIDFFITYRFYGTCVPALIFLSSRFAWVTLSVGVTTVSPSSGSVLFSYVAEVSVVVSVVVVVSVSFSLQDVITTPLSSSTTRNIFFKTDFFITT